MLSTLNFSVSLMTPKALSVIRTLRFPGVLAQQIRESQAVPKKAVLRKNRRRGEALHLTIGDIIIITTIRSTVLPHMMNQGNKKAEELHPTEEHHIIEDFTDTAAEMMNPMSETANIRVR
ncbi:MAG: hypothetical protein Q4A32_05830 [Lachnospiraceae bacterium]|nr:hypothetical protein [Lachnospiraceae bacterium]